MPQPAGRLNLAGIAAAQDHRKITRLRRASMPTN